MSSARGRRTQASAGDRRRSEADGRILTRELLLDVLDPHVGDTPERRIDVYVPATVSRPALD